MDTHLDTLCEFIVRIARREDPLRCGRLSFLEISTFPEMLIYSTPTISSIKDRKAQGFAVFLWGCICTDYCIVDEQHYDNITGIAMLP